MDRLAAMETFVRVIEAGSFSSAAKQLRVGQPAVSKTIAQLEDRLGVRLLLRSTHRLTPDGAFMSAPSGRSRRPRKLISQRVVQARRCPADSGSARRLPSRGFKSCRV